MSNLINLISSLLLVFFLVLATVILYRVIRMPGSHRINRIGEDGKIQRSTFGILLVIILAVVTVLSILLHMYA